MTLVHLNQRGLRPGRGAKTEERQAVMNDSAFNSLNKAEASSARCWGWSGWS